MKSIQQRLESNLRQNDNGCLEWQGSGDRYGVIAVNGKRVKTHRLAWEIKNGEIPEGMMVLHKCDNPPCCNIEHLFIGTQKDNMQDALKKERLKLPFCPDNKKARGEKNGMFIHRAKFTGSNNNNAKLNDSQRDLICSLKSQGVTADLLAKQFNVSASQILIIARSRGIKRRPLKWTDKQRDSIMSARHNKTKGKSTADALLIATYGTKQH